jgi:hypothetical protein
MPDYTPGFNRYAYALNNPLVYTDPDGEWVWFIPIGMAVWAGGKVLQQEAQYGNIGQGWGYLGSAMQMGGFMMMGAGIGSLISAGAPAWASSGFGEFAYTGFMNYASAYTMAGFGGYEDKALEYSAMAFVSSSSLYFANEIFGKFPMHNTAKYMLSSTLADMTKNIYQDKPLFSDLDYGFNIGFMLPFTIDYITLTAEYWANSHKIKSKIHSLVSDKIKKELKGKVEKGSYLKYDFQINKIDIGLLDDKNFGIHVDYDAWITDSNLKIKNSKVTIQGFWPQKALRIFDSYNKYNPYSISICNRFTYNYFHTLYVNIY